MANWFECRVRYGKQMENGAIKKVTEPYMVDAESVTEAEARITEEVAPFARGGDFMVKSAKQTPICEIFLDETAEKWYNVKFAIITLDEKTAKEKKQVNQTLVCAAEFKDAYDNFTKGMQGTLVDYEILAITATPILDVFGRKKED